MGKSSKDIYDQDSAESSSSDESRESSDIDEEELPSVITANPPNSQLAVFCRPKDNNNIKDNNSDKDDEAEDTE